LIYTVQVITMNGITMESYNKDTFWRSSNKNAVLAVVTLTDRGREHVNNIYSHKFRNL
jgi:hypothetical protein